MSKILGWVALSEAVAFIAVTVYEMITDFTASEIYIMPNFILSGVMIALWISTRK